MSGIQCLLLAMQAQGNHRYVCVCTRVHAESPLTV